MYQLRLDQFVSFAPTDTISWMPSGFTLTLKQVYEKPDIKLPSGDRLAKENHKAFIFRCFYKFAALVKSMFPFTDFLVITITRCCKLCCELPGELFLSL